MSPFYFIVIAVLTVIMAVRICTWFDVLRTK